MNKKTPKLKLTDRFNSLVSNAIDFLEQSIEELKTKPKYSVINFCASIELFLKARLLLEHWTLITQEPHNANLDKFNTGEFHSVYMTVAIKRLKDILQTRIGSDAEITFDKLRDRRNRLVHFYHEDYVGIPDETTLEQIVSEQCRGWFYLHELLTVNWKEEFSLHLAKIDELHQLMKRQRGFLQAKFDRLQPSLQKGIDEGSVQFCSSCGFSAQTIKASSKPFYDYKCLVCEFSGTEIYIHCPNCGEEVKSEDGEAFCSKCEIDVFSDYMEQFYPFRPKDRIDFQLAHCADCEHENTVVMVNEEKGFLRCYSCASEFEESNLERCPKCSELVATHNSESLWTHGCPNCVYL